MGHSLKCSKTLKSDLLICLSIYLSDKSKNKRFSVFSLINLIKFNTFAIYRVWCCNSLKKSWDRGNIRLKSLYSSNKISRLISYVRRIVIGDKRSIYQRFRLYSTSKNRCSGSTLFEFSVQKCKIANNLLSSASLVYNIVKTIRDSRENLRA